MTAKWTDVDTTGLTDDQARWATRIAFMLQWRSSGNEAVKHFPRRPKYTMKRCIDIKPREDWE